MNCKEITSDEGQVCEIHGGAWTEGGCVTATVLAEVAEHRRFQYENYGSNRDLLDGTGKDVQWLKPVTDAAWEHFNHSHYPFEATAFDIEGLFREEWDYDVDPKAAYTWLMLLREEFAEVAAQVDPMWLDAELTQVAALAVSWKEKLAERRLGLPSKGEF